PRGLRAPLRAVRHTIERRGGGAGFLKTRERTRPRADRRVQIVHAAAAVLGRQGYENTARKEIAQEVGVAPGLLHYYFDSKEELLTEVVEQLHREVEAEWLAASEDLSDARERSATGLDAGAAKCRARAEFFRLRLDMC